MNIYFSAPKYVVDKIEEWNYVPYWDFCFANSIKEAVKMFAESYRGFYNSFYVVEQNTKYADMHTLLMVSPSMCEREWKRKSYQVKIYWDEDYNVTKIGMRHAASRQGKGK